MTPPSPPASPPRPVLAIAPSNWRLLWLSLRTGFLYGAIIEVAVLLARAAGLLRPIPGLILLFLWGVQSNVAYASGRDRSDGYRGGAVAALLLASLFALLTSLGVACSGGEPAWGWFGFAFSLLLNWGAAVERRLRERRATRARPLAPPGWPRVPWYSWSFLGIAVFILLLAVSSFLDSRRLEREGVVARATVTDLREHLGRRGTTFEVRYVFRVAPGGVEYSATDHFPFPRRQLWVELPKDLWEQTLATRTLEVRYVAGAPEINRAEATEPKASLGLLLFASFGLVFAALLVAASWHGWIPPD